MATRVYFSRNKFLIYIISYTISNVLDDANFIRNLKKMCWLYEQSESGNEFVMLKSILYKYEFRVDLLVKKREKCFVYVCNIMLVDGYSFQVPAIFCIPCKINKHYWTYSYLYMSPWNQLFPNSQKIHNRLQ